MRHNSTNVVDLMYLIVSFHIAHFRLLSNNGIGIIPSFAFVQNRQKLEIL